MLETMGWISIVPVALAVILAFATRNTIASLATACILGCFLAGKGIFGFTDLSSMGAASDHIDHVKTQLPYALTVAGLCAVTYLILGIVIA